MFSHILALSLVFSRMTLLLITLEPFPKTAQNFGLCLLPYVLQYSIVLLERSLHCANIPWNLPYYSPSVIPANSTYKCYLQKFGSVSKKSSLPADLSLNLHSQLSYNWFGSFSPPFFVILVCSQECSSSPASVAPSITDVMDTHSAPYCRSCKQGTRLDLACLFFFRKYILSSWKKNNRCLVDSFPLLSFQ